MIHNQLTDSAELLNGIGRAAGLSEGDGVIRLGETLDPTLDVWSQPEWAYLRAERLGAGRLAAPAVAAEFAIVAVGNAIGSGSIVVIEAVSVQCAAAIAVSLEVAADSIVAGTLSAAAFMVSGRDRRFGSTTGRVFAKLGTDVGNTFGVQLEQRTTSTVAFVDFTSPPIILKPGDDLLIIGQTVNTLINTNFKWRERKAFKNELPA